eukprot:3171157-Prymnesium_polylepis.1
MEVGLRRSSRRAGGSSFSSISPLDGSWTPPDGEAARLSSEPLSGTQPSGSNGEQAERPAPSQIDQPSAP